MSYRLPSYVLQDAQLCPTGRLLLHVHSQNVSLLVICIVLFFLLPGVHAEVCERGCPVLPPSAISLLLHRAVMVVVVK